MSDLAQSIVTVLRDKALSDLLDETELLRQQLKQCRAVTVTGPDGTPVYATGQFNEGNYEYADEPNLWQVALQQLQPCPLTELENVEIQCGGILKAKFPTDNPPVNGRVDDPELEEGWGAINFRFPARHGGLLLDIRVGSPLSPDAFFEVATRAARNLHVFLSKRLTIEHPHLIVQFDQISFMVSEVNMAIQNLSSDPTTIEDVQSRLRELQERLGNTEAVEAMVLAEDEIQQLVDTMPEETAREMLAMPETFPADINDEARAVLRRMLRERFEDGEMAANEENEDVDHPP